MALDAARVFNEFPAVLAWFCYRVVVDWIRPW